jgi:Flp pilus assembly protein TadB
VLKWRQSLNQLERAFVEEAALDRDRRELLRRTAERRTAKRRSERAIKQGKSRFIVLSVTLLATAVVVSVVMFRVLYLLLE